MPRLVIKNSYIKGGGGRAVHLSNLVKYIATRDGVELVYHNPSAKATTKQKNLINQILRDFPNSKNSFEYEDYNRNHTVSNASDFITTALEQNFDRVAKKENYVGYIAYRPNAERLERHGLFTSGDEKIILSKVAEEIANHKGNVWTPIISLRREDAVETGYDNAERWKNMIESYVPTIAESMKIPIDNFKWYASFHNESHHPHIHMICYSTDTRYGYLNQNGIEKIKSGMVKEIFKEQLYDIYQRQTQSRDKLKIESEKVFRELKQKVFVTDFTSPKLAQLILALGEKLENVKGKKQFGYLQPHVKDVVNAIVDELAQEPSIKSAYELWCELQKEVYQSYSDNLPPQIPLSQQKEFKSIKNMVICEVLNLGLVTKQSNEVVIDEEVDGKNNEVLMQADSYEHYHRDITNFSDMKKEQDTKACAQWKNPSVGMCVSRLLGSLGRLFEEQLPKDSTTIHQKIDSKAMRKIREKKLALGQKIGQQEEENIALRLNM